jgi:hypothetical protein
MTTHNWTIITAISPKQLWTGSVSCSNRKTYIVKVINENKFQRNHKKIFGLLLHQMQIKLKLKLQHDTENQQRKYKKILTYHWLLGLYTVAIASWMEPYRLEAYTKPTRHFSK